MSVVETGTLTDIWEVIQDKLDSNPAPYADLNATYEFQLVDLKHQGYQLDFLNGKAIVYNAPGKEANCVLKMKEKYFRKFLQGDLNSTTAFMTGKLKVDGNIGLALKLEGLLKKYDFTN